MNVLKPGAYVRTDDGVIAAITKVDESFQYEGQEETITKLEIDRDYQRDEYNNHISNCIYSSWLVDVKPRIVDLLREGDFINGEMITAVLDEFLVTTNCAHSKDTLTDGKALSILTQEQYDRSSYRPKVLIKTTEKVK